MKWFEKTRHLFKIYLPSNSLRKRFAEGMTWVIAGSLFRQGASFLVGILVARLLGLQDFGKLAVLQSTIYMLANFGQAGIGLSATKYIASSRKNDRERSGRIIAFSLMFTGISALLTGTLMFLFSESFAEMVLPKGDLAMEFRIASGWVLFEMISLLQLRLFAGLEAFRRSAYLNLIQAVLLLPAIYLGINNWGLVGGIVALFAVSVLNCIIGHFLLIRAWQLHNIKINFGNILQERRILDMSIMVWLSEVAMNTTNWLAGILLARSPNGLAEFALFNAASRFQSVLVFFPLRIFQVAVPVLANLEADGNRRSFTKGLMGVGLLGLVITMFGAIIFIVFSEQLMSFYGKGFAGGAAVLQIMALCCVVSAAWTIASAGLWAAEKSRQMLALDCLRAILLVTICILGFADTAKNLVMAYLTSYSIALFFLILALIRLIKQPRLISD